MRTGTRRQAKTTIEVLVRSDIDAESSAWTTQADIIGTICWAAKPPLRVSDFAKPALSDAFAVQDQVAGAAAAALKRGFTPVRSP